MPDKTEHTDRMGAGKRFLRNPLAVAGMLIIIMAVIAGLAGYLLVPDKSPHANQQHIEIAARKPGFRVSMLKVRKNELLAFRTVAGRMIFGQRTLYNYIPFNAVDFKGDTLELREYDPEDAGFKSTRQFHIADIVYPLDPADKRISYLGGQIEFNDISGQKLLVDPAELKQKILDEYIMEKKFLLGTDRFGRDFFSRLVLGTRVSLSVGFISVSISLVIGLILGALSGYFRGLTDDIIMWFINVVWSIPTLLMVIAITLVLGKGFWQVFVAVGLTMWVEVARVVRGQVLGVREVEYVQAAKALGFSDLRILFRHILPNVITPVIIISAANFASAILIEAGLSFLGIGVQPPIPSWGTMIKDHYGFIIVDKAYLAFLPGLAIMFMVLAFTLVGNGLRDAFDVRRREG